MKQSPYALYALLIAPDPKMRRAIVEGTKKVSVREGYRDYCAGRKVMLCCHLEPWAVMADIIDVRHPALWQVTQEEWELNGYDSQAALLHGLKRFYPNIGMGSPVTVIRWDNVSGALVDKANERKERKRSMSLALQICCHCQSPATWIRKTQFSKDHTFCDACARKENDFGKEEPGCFYWVNIE